MNTLQDDNPNLNVRNFVLDPLSVIIKLAILAHKPVGTKVCIHSNIMSFQEPGPFQAFCRILYQSNKTDLHYMYNPIQLAGSYFYSREYIKKQPRMEALFVNAQIGLEKLIETYKTNSTIRHSLNYYHAIITNYVRAKYDTTLFRKDGMSMLYSEGLLAELNAQWTDKWIGIILDMVGFLGGGGDTTEDNQPIAYEKIKALEQLMQTIDAQTQKIIDKCK